MDTGWPSATENRECSASSQSAERYVTVSRGDILLRLDFIEKQLPVTLLLWQDHTSHACNNPSTTLGTVDIL